jgi:hypothetical protein
MCLPCRKSKIQLKASPDRRIETKMGDAAKDGEATGRAGGNEQGNERGKSRRTWRSRGAGRSAGVLETPGRVMRKMKRIVIVAICFALLAAGAGTLFAEPSGGNSPDQRFYSGPEGGPGPYPGMRPQEMRPYDRRPPYHPRPYDFRPGPGPRPFDDRPPYGPGPRPRPYDHRPPFGPRPPRPEWHGPVSYAYPCPPRPHRCDGMEQVIIHLLHRMIDRVE